MNHATTDPTSDFFNTLLEAMTADLERRYADQLQAFETAVKLAATVAQQNKLRSEVIANFLSNVSVDFPKITEAPELAAALIHKSQVDGHGEVFNLFVDSERAKEVYDLSAERSTVDLMIVQEMYQRGILKRYGVPYTNSAISFLRRGQFIHKYWQDRSLGPILSATGVERNIRFVTLAYCKLVAAIRLRFGEGASRDFLLRTLDPIGTIEAFGSEISMGDPKTFLQEYLQSSGSSVPKYLVARIQGTPDHEPSFVAEVTVPSIGSLTAVGPSKHSATMKVSEQAIIALEKNPTTRPKYARFYLDRLSRNSRGQRTFHEIPAELRQYKTFVDQTFSVSCDPALLLEATTSVDLATRSFSGYVTNGILCYMGSMLIEALLEEYGARQASVRLHPTLLDALEPRLGISRIQHRVFGRAPVHGPDRKRDAVQAVLYVAYLGGEAAFREWFFGYVDKNWHYLSADLDMRSAVKIRTSAFDRDFSYTQALQEYTQSVDKSLPSYKDVVDVKNPHAPTHHSIVTWRGFSGRGTGSRTSWSRNMAAWDLMKKLHDGR